MSAASCCAGNASIAQQRPEMQIVAILPAHPGQHRSRASSRGSVLAVLASRSPRQDTSGQAPRRSACRQASPPSAPARDKMLTTPANAAACSPPWTRSRASRRTALLARLLLHFVEKRSPDRSASIRHFKQAGAKLPPEASVLSGDSNIRGRAPYRREALDIVGLRLPEQTVAGAGLARPRATAREKALIAQHAVGEKAAAASGWTCTCRDSRRPRGS